MIEKIPALTKLTCCLVLWYPQSPHVGNFGLDYGYHVYIQYVWKLSTDCPICNWNEFIHIGKKFLHVNITTDTLSQDQSEPYIHSQFLYF